MFLIVKKNTIIFTIIGIFCIVVVGIVFLTNSINVSTDNIGKEVTISIPMQVNISVNLVRHNYKNIKEPDETGLSNTYRITKMTGAVTVTAVQNV